MKEVVRPLKFDIQLFDLAKETNFTVYHSYIELQSKCFRYRMAYRSDQWIDDDDETRGKRNLLTDVDLKIKKEYFVSIAKYWRDQENGKYWYIEIEFNGYPNNVKIYFAADNRKGMEEIYDALEKYFDL